MKQLLTRNNHRKFTHIAFMVLSVITLAGHTVVNAYAAPTGDSATTILSTAAKGEVDRRLAEIPTNQKLVKAASSTNSEASAKILSSLDDVKKDLDSLSSKLKTAGTDKAKVKDVASQIDKNFAAYQATNQASKIIADINAQQELSNSLNKIADSIQNTIDAAKTNGATHVNGGVAGFISLKSVQTSLDQLKQNLKANSASTKSTLSALGASETTGLS